LAGAVVADRAVGDEDLTEVEVRHERAAGPDPDRTPDSELGELADHEGGARSADPGRLDRQLEAIGGLAVVAPEPAGVVRHQRLDEQLLSEQEGPARVSGEERLRSGRSCRLEMERHRERSTLDGD
jgi:hypothetical protein